MSSTKQAVARRFSGFHAPHHTPRFDFPSTSCTSPEPRDMDADSFDRSQYMGGFDAEEDPTSGPSKFPPSTPEPGPDDIPLVPRYQNIDGTCNLFQELQDVLASGEPLFSDPATALNQFPCDDILLNEDMESNFGIELPAETFLCLLTYPWPTKAHFLTVILFNSPRLPFSDPQKKAILDWAKELVKKIVGDPTKKVVSPFGNVFYINDVAKAIAKDYANPLTRFVMQDFPEDSGSGMSQVFHGEKILHEQPSPPSVCLLQDSSGVYFIPERFFLASPSVASGSGGRPADTKELFALGHAAERTEVGFIVGDEKEIIPTSVFRRSYEDIAFRRSELTCGLTESSKKYVLLEPNPWRKKSGGRMVYAVPLVIFMDDVSGNISKQWNKHYVIYMSNANLPREMLDQEFCVWFVTSSPHASPMELMHGMKQSILSATESGIIAWDCQDNEEVMLIHSGNLCTPEGMVNEINNQFVNAKLSGATEKMGKKLRKRGASVPAMKESEVKAALEKELEDLLNRKNLDDVINPLLGMNGMNIHLDTPTEILHTILLGVVKYFWGQTVYLIEKAKLLDIFQSCLDSINHDTLNAPNTCRRFAQLDLVKHIITGGYWYEQELQKWVCAGPFVLSFLCEHPAQGKLLGIKSNEDPCETNAGNRRLSSQMQWIGRQQHVRKSQPAQLTQAHKPAYYQGDAFISKHGDKVKLDGNVIFKYPPSTTGFAIGWERVLTTRTKPVIRHELTGKYLLNTYSIHNYAFIRTALPSVQKVRSRAVQQVREKKAQHQSNQTPQEVTASPSIPTMPPPAFDQSIPKPKQNKRRKGPSQPTSSAMPAPSAPEAPSQSNQSSQQATHPTSSATPAPSLLQAPPPFSPIHTMPTPCCTYPPQGIITPSQDSPYFTRNCEVQQLYLQHPIPSQLPYNQPPYYST
ncbi:hypothetical protein BKA82DRAFT_4326857 [Pisolithus tinctorius]|nr:hypothetical protein BKA82DRAFT_4326857 [Pisolithus tinctorius]